MKTRDRIKASSIALFNEKGATNVSTVQISEHLGISPGNLYYYFTNKEHIIHSIWEEDMVPQSDRIFLNVHADDPEATLAMMMDGILQYGMKFQFFYTEQYTLFKNDPALQKKYRARWDGLIEKLTDVFVLWQEKGYMRPSSHQWKKELVEYFLTTGPAYLRSNLSIHPEYTTEEAFTKAVNGVLLIVSGDFVEPVCEKMLARLKG